MAGTDKASTEETPAVDAPAEATTEEAFDDAFDEFVSADPPPDTGRTEDTQQAEAEASAETTDDDATSGEESSDETEEAAASDDAAAEDIWKDATPAQRAAFEAAQHENRSHRGRTSALDRKLNATSAATPHQAPSPEDVEKWEQFKAEYPEVAGPMEQRFESRLTRLETENAELRTQVTGITDDQIQDAINDQEALLGQRHPDWEQLTASDDFSTWLPNQPRYVQEGFARNGKAIVDGQEAASLINLFKVDHPAAAGNDPSDAGDTPAKDTTNTGMDSRRQRRLKSAVTAESGQAGPGAGPPEGDFDAAFDHFANQP